MFTEIDTLVRANNTLIHLNELNSFLTLMGKRPIYCQADHYLEFLKIVAYYVYKMYCVVLKNRKGIG